MGTYGFKELKKHVGHNVVCVGYGKPFQNVAIECEDCNEVLFDYDEGEKP